MIEADGLVATRGATRLLDGVSLSVDRGAWLGVIGPNGAGKTTLLRCLAGLERPTNGCVRIDGRDVAELSPRERARLLAVVPQHPMLPPGMKVLDYVLLGRTAHIPVLGSERPIDLEVVHDVVDRLELGPFTGRELTSLSGGERQRAVIARGLAQGAPVLVLDEPTTALDIGHQQDVLELLGRLREGRSLTIVSAMHDLTLAAQHGDTFVLLTEGRVRARGDARHVFTVDTLRDAFAASIDVIDDDDGLVVVPRRATIGNGARPL